MRIVAVVVVVLFSGGLMHLGCTRPNPQVCCLTASDCAQIGLNETRTCAAGLACVNELCVPQQCTSDAECHDPNTPVCSGGVCAQCDASHGCTFSVPACSLGGTCGACSLASDCAPYPTRPTCDTTTGACVQCLDGTQCTGGTPICDNGECRACAQDSECSSGACASDGTCIAEQDAIYVAPGGTDSGACPRAAPCATLPYAIGQAVGSRTHVVLAPSTYATNVLVAGTSASSVAIHGGGSTLREASPSSAVIKNSNVPLELDNMTIVNATTAAIDMTTGTLKHVSVNNSKGILLAGTVSATDVDVTNASGAAVTVSQSATVTWNRGVIVGGFQGIAAQGGSTTFTVALTNLVIARTTDVALYFYSAAGTISFSTIADSGSNSAQIDCTAAPGLHIDHSIIWSTNASLRPTTGACSLTSSIAGPVTVAGAMNVDPMFVDELAGDYHIKATSPANDAANSGPPIDVEGIARPQGAGFDLGAYEVK